MKRDRVDHSHIFQISNCLATFYNSGEILELFCITLNVGMATFHNVLVSEKR